jgi:D-methionine transport system permease protein
MTSLVLQSLTETLLMVGLSALASIVLGLPLAILLTITAPGGLAPKPVVYRSLDFLVNAARSIPYIILTVLLVPVTRHLVGTSIGTFAAIVPLSLAGTLLIARHACEALRMVPHGLIEVGLAMGASRLQIIRKIMLEESLPSLISGSTTVIINLIGFSAMAGAVGGGGLGDLAIRYGYQRYDITLMLIIVAILIVFVQLVQTGGNYMTRSLTK